MMRYGYMGKFLRIDLNEGTVTPEEVPQDLLEDFIGGRGLNSALLYREVPAGADPLGPENRLIVGTGPGNGTIIPGGTRFTMSAKSPLTGLLGDANSGADFGAGLKYAGYDGLIVQGRSREPVYLWIDDGEAELRPAEHLWGKNAAETQNSLKREAGDPEVSIITIGVAGEKQVAFAAVMGGGSRAAGRTGMGAVMGSKNLKAVVVRGRRGVRVADRKALEEAVRFMDESMRSDAKNYESMTEFGTIGLTKKYNEVGMLPSYNFRQGTFPDMERLYPEHVKTNFLSRNRSCFSCPLGCFYTYHISDGPYAGTFGEHIELSGTTHAGPKIGNADPALMIRVYHLMNDYGMDIMDTTACIALVVDCYENGIISSEELGGLEPKWGDSETILSLIEMMAHRQGIGEILGDGLKKASEAIGRGAEKFAVHSKGLSVTATDPRAGNAYGFAYAVASRGADHCRTLVTCERVFDPEIARILPSYEKADPFSTEGKAELVVFHENLRAVQNCLQVCLFVVTHGKSMIPSTMTALYNAVTGNGWDEGRLIHAGERIINMERAFNLREGLESSDDTLPARFMEEPMPDGTAAGRTLPLEELKREYYALRGWDPNTGYPTRDKLESLGLGRIADDLAAMGKLG
jgi:aldehyde:ferredoxin oxidoreductase